MSEAQNTEALYKAYFEWLEKKSTLRGKLKTQFTRWVGVTYSALFTPYQQEPAVFHQLCQQIKQGQVPHAVVTGLSFQIIAQYALRLLRYYNTLPSQRRAKTFVIFIEQIRSGCISREELEALLVG